MDQLNLFAVVAAAVSSFVIGGLWYSPLLFQKAWMTANNFKESDLQNANMAVIFGVSFVFALVMALNLAMFLNAPDTTLSWGATAGALTAIWVALGIRHGRAVRAASLVLHPREWRLLAGRPGRHGRDHRRLALNPCDAYHAGDRTPQQAG